MTELLTISANYLAALNEKEEWKPMVETILVTSEPVYGVDAAGDLTRQRNTGQFRFCASPSKLRKLSAALLELADEAERLTPPVAPKS